MIISIDAANGLAIYDQIVRQIKFAIASEVLLPGELIPSVREMAKQAAVNPNTVSRAYRELQSEGILDIVRGTGLQVTTGAVRKCRKDRQGLIQERLRAVLKEAQQSQLEVDEIRQLIDSELARLNGKGTAE
ncbi:MAG: GntR family transcriptional regulator [Planctomycetota bacterium]|nr:GntR family transcriptional regulator [Planctomycetota bacterium]MDA0919348.1 GntR family transcriptional regulator [Planctomycetota bacterium]MDA1161246.1 GntR family transcriptional regulator [Planctomycetota bacterium]